jgi:hypothetical protein
MDLFYILSHRREVRDELEWLNSIYRNGFHEYSIP